MKKYEINTLLKLKKECPKISTDLLDLQRVIITNIENPELKNNIKNIKELLINERKNLINKYDELEKLQKKCKHEIRLTSIDKEHTCILCGKKISGENTFSWSESINRNNNYISFRYKKEDNPNGDFDIYNENGYTIEELTTITSNILESYNDIDEINLIQEFKQRNIKNMKIINKKDKIENYILVIDGTNKIYIDENNYIFRLHKNQTFKIVDYFSQIPSIKIKYIVNKEFKSSEEYKKIENNPNIKIILYNEISTIYSELNNDQDIPYKLIFNYSKLYTVTYSSNKINLIPYDLDLTIFNSKIITEEIKEENNLLKLKKDLYYSCIK